MNINNLEIPYGGFRTIPINEYLYIRYSTEKGRALMGLIQADRITIQRFTNMTEVIIRKGNERLITSQITEPNYFTIGYEVNGYLSITYHFLKFNEI